MTYPTIEIQIACQKRKKEDYLHIGFGCRAQDKFEKALRIHRKLDRTKLQELRKDNRLCENWMNKAREIAREVSEKYRCRVDVCNEYKVIFSEIPTARFRWIPIEDRRSVKKEE